MSSRKIKPPSRIARKDPRVAQLHDYFAVVSLQDAAVDILHSDVAAYHRTLDPAHIALLDGATPEVYVIRPLTANEQGQVFIAGGAACDRAGVTAGGACDSRGQTLAAFALGVVEVEGLDPSEELYVPPIEQNEIGSYVLALTTGRVDASWRTDLGKSSWPALWRARRSTVSTRPQAEPSTATPAAASSDDHVVAG